MGIHFLTCYNVDVLEADMHWFKLQSVRYHVYLYETYSI